MELTVRVVATRSSKRGTNSEFLVVSVVPVSSGSGPGHTKKRVGFSLDFGYCVMSDTRFVFVELYEWMEWISGVGHKADTAQHDFFDWTQTLDT